MTGLTGRAAHDITPNRRGARAREAVLDAAERLIAQRGYKAATVAALVEEAGVAASSIYHHPGRRAGRGVFDPPGDYRRNYERIWGR